MAKPKPRPKPKVTFPPHSIFLECGTFKIGATGTGIFALVAIAAGALLGRYLGLF